MRPTYERATTVPEVMFVWWMELKQETEDQQAELQDLKTKLYEVQGRVRFLKAELNHKNQQIVSMADGLSVLDGTALDAAAEMYQMRTGELPLDWHEAHHEDDMDVEVENKDDAGQEYHDDAEDRSENSDDEDDDQGLRDRLQAIFDRICGFLAMSNDSQEALVRFG